MARPESVGSPLTFLWFSIAVVVVAMVVVGGAMAFAAHRAPEGSRSDRTPTNLYAVTAGAMSLLVAFTFSAAFTQYTNVQAAMHNEAASLAGMYRASKFMEQPLQTEIQSQIRCYIRAIDSVEWQQMEAEAVATGNEAEAALMKMDDLLATPTGQKQAGVGLDMFETQTAARATSRQTRLAAATWSVPPIVYIMILIGSIITIGSLFMYADRAKPKWGNALVVIGPVFVLVAAFLVTWFFDHPFVDAPGALTTAPYMTTLNYMEYDLAQRGPLPALDCRPAVMPPSALKQS